MSKEWKPSIPETKWTQKALHLYNTMVDDIAGLATDAARSGAYEDATTLAILSDVLADLYAGEGLDSAFDAECERRFDLAMEYSHDRSHAEEIRERQIEARRLKR